MRFLSSGEFWAGVIVAVIVMWAWKKYQEGKG